jgi:hypothetical protein
MFNLLGLGKRSSKDVKVTIEYCPKSITLPYKVKKLINQSSLKVPTNAKDPSNAKDPFGFNEQDIHVGEFLTKSQLQHLVDMARNGKNDLNTVEIIEGSSVKEDLLLD